MKKAAIHWTGFKVSCPHCNEPIPEPKTGSFMWNINEALPPSVACASCGKEAALVHPRFNAA